MILGGHITASDELGKSNIFNKTKGLIVWDTETAEAHL